MTDRTPPLIAALLDPARYPHPVERVELMETHGAWVLLAGEHASKIKKPVRFPSMDFSPLALRRHACETEIRVNRRFQQHDRPPTQLSLGVLPIVGTPVQPRWGNPGTGDEAQAIEFAVLMRRFDEACRLDHLCERGALTPEHLIGLARRMAAFQARAAVAGTGQAWGHPTAAMRWPRENFSTLRTALTAPADAALVRELSDWTEQRFNAIEPLLSRRRQKGRVREVHGDLHLANLVLIQGNGEDEVLPFDAIEFNDSLRWIDVANDMAFAWMDLLGHGCPGLANVLLSAWLDASGDVSAPTVWSFFASYRAGVRAKVAAIRPGQVGGNPGGPSPPPTAPDPPPRPLRQWQALGLQPLARRRSQRARDPPALRRGTQAHARPERAGAQRLGPERRALQPAGPHGHLRLAAGARAPAARRGLDGAGGRGLSARGRTRRGWRPCR